MRVKQPVSDGDRAEQGRTGQGRAGQDGGSTDLFEKVVGALGLREAFGLAEDLERQGAEAIVPGGLEAFASLVAKLYDELDGLVHVAAPHADRNRALVRLLVERDAEYLCDPRRTERAQALGAQCILWARDIQAEEELEYVLVRPLPRGLLQRHTVGREHVEEREDTKKVDLGHECREAQREREPVLSAETVKVGLGQAGEEGAHAVL